MKHLTHRLLLALPLAVLAIVVSTGLAFAQTTFTFVSTPNPGATKNHIQSVAATSNSDVWAVGSFNNTATAPGNGAGGDRTLIEHWNGATWSAVSSPNASTASNAANNLESVSADSASDAWAVGNENPDLATSPVVVSLAEHWNGSAWSIVSVPTPPLTQGEIYGEDLLSVSADSASDAWAVGNFTKFNPFSSAGPVAHHWNGQAWGAPVALPSGVSQLQTVVALSPTNAWAAGVINNSASQLLHWNGSKWSIVTGPTLPRGNTVTFTDLSASSASDIWAIGIGSNGSGSGPLFAHFNGTAWQQITSSTDVQFFNNDYTTIAAHSSTDALVVGFNSITGSPAVDQWDGKSWNPVSFALPAGENLFSGNHGEGATFTPGGDAWIVGGALTSTQSTTTEQTFTAHCQSC